ncbi:MAG: alanine--tRNA ligase-related protein, partial [Planctomycetota bacterium]
TTIIAIWDGTQFLFDAPEGAHVAVICAHTNFYAQMGGQVGDTGTISSQDFEFSVEDTQICAGYVLHVGHSTRGKVTADEDVALSRNAPRRNAIARNHTCTHLLNHALRDVLGPNVDQKGSLVAPERLRFDFSHNSPISHDELSRTTTLIEKAVNDDLPVYAQPAPLDSAKQINSLRAVFGETYPDPVRIVSVGVPIPDLLADSSRDDWKSYSIEFCGGTHVASTSQIQLATITEEEAVAKGVRRIVMLTGNAAREAIDTGVKLRARAQVAQQLAGNELHDEISAIQNELESRTVSLIDAHIIRESLDQIREKLKAAQKESAKAGKAEAVDAARELADSSPASIVVGAIPAGGDRQALLAAMDCVRGNRPDAAIMLASVDDETGKVALAASCTKDNISAGLKAGDWVREVSGVLGGKGGGRPDSAQGGGTDRSKLDEALVRAASFASEKLG